MGKNNSIIVYQFAVDLCTLIAFIIGCSPIADQYELTYDVFVGIVIVLLIISIVLKITTRSVYNRKKLTKITNNLMSNAEKITMFGGDLTWAEDYEKTISKLTGASKRVDVIFPKPKFESANGAAKKQFVKNINILKEAGANIYYTNEDIGIRCTIINVDALKIHTIEDSEDLKIIISKRVHNNLKNSLRNKYRVSIYGMKKDHEKPLCILYCKYYIRISSDLNEYKEGALC